MCTLVFTMDGSMNIIALPSIASEFHTSPAGAVWVAVVLQFMILGLALPVGSLSAGFGRRRLFAIGLGVFLVGLAVSYFSPNLPALIAGRAVQGLGCALFLSTRNAIGMGGFPEASARHGIGRHHCCGGHRRRDGPPAGRPTHRRIRLALYLHRRGAPCADNRDTGWTLCSCVGSSGSHSWTSTSSELPSYLSDWRPWW